MKTIHRLPNTQSPNGWNAILPPRTAHPSLTDTKEVDWLIIGGGYAGLAAARRLSQCCPQARIAVLEAHIIGENASGKNSGFAIDLPHYSNNDVASTASAKMEIQLYRQTLKQLEQHIKQHNIACDWQQVGRYHAAVTDKLGIPLLANYRHNLEQWQEPYQEYRAEQLQQALGTSHYRHAIYTAGTYLCNPAALIRGLADSLPSSVLIFEQSPVIKFDFSKERKIAHTPQGSIHSANVIIAVNSFLQQFGIYRWRQVPMVLYATLTEALTDKEISTLGNIAQWGITPAHGTVGATLRLTQDRRLFIRHGFHHSPNLTQNPNQLTHIQASHLQMLKTRFAHISPRAAHTWMGWLAISHNHMPIFGAASPNVWVVSCCNGAGIVRHSAAGALIVDQALGIENPFITTYLAGGQASLLPPRPFLDIGFKLVASWEQWRGKSEQ